MKLYRNIYIKASYMESKFYFHYILLSVTVQYYILPNYLLNLALQHIKFISDFVLCTHICW